MRAPEESAAGPPPRTLEEVERDHILAARVLALNRNTLRWRMKKLGLL